MEFKKSLLIGNIMTNMKIAPSKIFIKKSLKAFIKTLLKVPDFHLYPISLKSYIQTYFQHHHHSKLLTYHCDYANTF